MAIKPSNILVTGGTGFLGRSLVRKLVTDGHSIQVISRSKKYPEHPKITTHYGNITSLQDLKQAIRGCTAVFHCAAEKNDLEQMETVNVAATRLLFNLASDSKIKFFCHLSSVGVIGKTNQRVVDELTPCNPMNLYEETKYAAEKIVNQGMGSGSVVVLRPTNVFGAETLQPWLDDSLRSRMRLLLKGNENAHLVYAEDVAAAAAYLLHLPSDNAVSIYNVSCDEDTGNTYREVQNYLASKTQKAPHPFVITAPLSIPYCIRWIRNGGKTNCGDVIYSSQRLRDAGFHYPYGLQMGLCEAVNSLLGLSSLP